MHDPTLLFGLDLDDKLHRLISLSHVKVGVDTMHGGTCISRSMSAIPEG